MRLNDGLPVWHASISYRDRYGLMIEPTRALEDAADLLSGVGKPDGEWWLFSGKYVGHLRVGLSAAEVKVRWPDGCPLATADAGESGEYRERTKL